MSHDRPWKATTTTTATTSFITFVVAIGLLTPQHGDQGSITVAESFSWSSSYHRGRYLKNPIVRHQRTLSSKPLIPQTLPESTRPPFYAIFDDDNDNNDSTGSFDIFGSNQNVSPWLLWMTGGKPRDASKVKMREAAELGGIPRSDRYSSRFVLMGVSFSPWIHENRCSRNVVYKCRCEPYLT